MRVATSIASYFPTACWSMLRAWMLFSGLLIVLFNPAGWLCMWLIWEGMASFEDPVPPLDFQTYPDWLYQFDVIPSITAPHAVSWKTTVRRLPVPVLRKLRYTYCEKLKQPM